MESSEVAVGSGGHGGLFSGIMKVLKKLLSCVLSIVKKFVKYWMPVAYVSGIHMPSISLRKIGLSVDLRIKNRAPLPIPLADINYSFENDGKKVISGSITDAGTIRAHSQKTVTFEVEFAFEDIKNLGIDIRPGSVNTFTIKIDINVNVPIIGVITVPMSKDVSIPIPHMPDVHLEKVELEKFSLDETVGVFHMQLENKNEFQMGLKALEYDISISDVSIGSAVLEKSTPVGEKGTTYIEIPITFKPKDLGSAVWDVIKGQSLSYGIKGHITADTPFGSMKLPISKEGSASLRRKKKDH